LALHPLRDDFGAFVTLATLDGVTTDLLQQDEGKTFLYCISRGKIKDKKVNIH
jgi:hypothetical protein